MRRILMSCWFVAWILVIAVSGCNKSADDGSSSSSSEDSGAASAGSESSKSSSSSDVVRTSSRSSSASKSSSSSSIDIGRRSSSFSFSEVSRSSSSSMATLANDWYAEWKKDETAFRTKYKGKPVELAGTVQRAGEDTEAPDGGHGFVVLAVDDSAVGVMCLTKDKTPWLRVCEGSRVTIRGKGDDSAPGLTECELTEVGDNPGIMVPAKELAKDFSPSRAGQQVIYQKKPLYVEGELVIKTPIENGVGSIMLKGDGNLLVVCRFNNAPREKFAAIKARSNVKVLGRLSADPTATKGELRIDAEALAEVP